jgi:hypothetical protein
MTCAISSLEIVRVKQVLAAKCIIRSCDRRMTSEAVEIGFELYEYEQIMRAHNRRNIASWTLAMGTRTAVSDSVERRRT